MRVCPSVGRSVGRSVGPLVMLLSAGRDEPANDLFCVYELVFLAKVVDVTKNPRMDQPSDIASYRVACTRLERHNSRTSKTS